MTDATILKTPLHALHVELGARMGPFAGYDMPIQYPAGVLAEHLHTRKSAGLFDVSHMGQALIEGADHGVVAAFLEQLCPADFQSLAPGRQRYTQLLNGEGGIVDDLMVTRPPGADGALRLVVNAARKEVDFLALRERLPAGVKLTPLPEAALIALQGPLAAATVAALAERGDAVKDRVYQEEGLETMPFMSARPARIAGVETFVSRSGYTGEDGYEISLDASKAESFARLLLSQPGVAPIGLGARDSLRLEAGLCLYGHELDETIDPVEAALVWSIQKRRRAEGGFPGAKRIQDALANGPSRQRVGLRPDGRAPAREGAEIVSADGAPIGAVTSGGFGPSVGGPIAMGYVARAHAAVGTPVGLMVRGKLLSARVVALPFHPHAYYRG
jgi:aminomethyltransferase